MSLVSESSSPKQMSLVPKSSSPEKMQLLFTPLMLASEPSGTLTSSMLPVEILRKIGRFASVEAMRNLIATCKYIRNQPNTWFLQLLASKIYPDRATSGFIVDAIGNKGNTCLWCNVKFFIKDHGIPKELSIHLFANTTAEKISSDEVRSMIIQVSGLPISDDPFDSFKPPKPFNPPDLHHDIRKFLTFLFPKVSFKKLKCLMLCGIELSNEFSQDDRSIEIGCISHKKFPLSHRFGHNEFFDYCNSLKTLYVVHPDRGQYVYPPRKLKKLVIYCPKSSKDMIERRGVFYTGLPIDVERCHALKEM